MSIDYEFDAPGDPERVAGVLEIVAARVDLTKIRLLDLACRTGAFARAFAAKGASVLGIEGKGANFERIPETPNAEFIQEDVRWLNVERHGQFDVTLCLGILYHLDAADALDLLRDMREVTTEFAVVDTHVGLPHTMITVAGNDYAGNWYNEGVPGPWSSLGNERSFWFTDAALHAACRHVGWEVEVLPGIRWPGEPAGRHWMVLS